MNYILLILAGALGCNGIPHTVAGLQGRPFPTPFAKPPGVGSSSPLVNFAWGSANLVLGLVLGSRRMALAAPVPGVLASAAGFVATGTYLSWHFGKVRKATEGQGGPASAHADHRTDQHSAPRVDHARC